MQVNYGLGEKTKGPWMSEYVNFVHGIDRVLIVRETWFGYDCLKIIPQSWFVERDTKTVRDYVYSHYPFIQAEHKGKFETYLRDEINNHIGKLVVLHFTIPDTSAPKHGTGSGTSSDLQTLENKSQNINSMTNIDRIVLLLALTFHKMGKNIFDSFSMSDLYMIAGMFVIWAGSQFFGVGEVIDAALLAWLWWTIGWDCWRFIVIIINSVKTAIQATSIQQIDDAASQLAPAAAALGIDALMGFILHKFGKGSAVEEAAKKEIKTEEDLVQHDFAQKANAVIPKKITTADLLKQSTATKEELTKHLEFLKANKRIDLIDVKNFVQKDIWPEGQNIPRSSEAILPDGSIDWPLHSGFVLDSNGMPILERISLPKGTIIDRYGHEFGNFTSPLQANGKPYEFVQRAMSNIYDPRTYHQYEVIGDLSVSKGEIAPAFGDVGGGIQYKLDESVNSLIKKNILKEIPVN